MLSYVIFLCNILISITNLFPQARSDFHVFVLINYGHNKMSMIKRERMALLFLSVILETLVNPSQQMSVYSASAAIVHSKSQLISISKINRIS